MQAKMLWEAAIQFLPGPTEEKQTVNNKLTEPGAATNVTHGTKTLLNFGANIARATPGSDPHQTPPPT
mgnify:CR=1 FL=1